jgi:hypothetical protein
MGSTHYWRRGRSTHDAAKFAELAKVAQKVVDLATGRGIEIGDALGEGKSPTITDEVISLNGVGRDSHESFVVSLKPDEFDFCKTNQKPYDDVVVAILVLYKHFFPGIEFSSDGSLGELQAGLELAKEALGCDLVLTKGRTSFEVSIQKDFVLSGSDLELVKQAISFLKTHIDEASDELDTEIDEATVDALEAKLYGEE